MKDQKNGVRFEELEDRIQRMELATGVREQLVRKGKLKNKLVLTISHRLVQNDVD